MERYLVIVSRDRPELLATLASTYGQKGEVEILFDRRQGQPWTEVGDRPDRRSRPRLDADLRDHGFIVIRRPELAYPSR
jgi:hypothetical protein